MQDLTELVLTGTFAIALGLFAVSSLARKLFRERDVEATPSCAPEPSVSLEPLPDRMNPEASPYDPPVEAGRPPEIPSGRVPVWFYRPVDLLGVAFVFVLFAALVTASLKGPERDVSRLNAGVMLVNIGFQFFTAGLVALTVVFRVNVVTWLGLRWPAWPWVFLIAPCSVVSMWLVFGGLQLCGYAEWMRSLGVETVQDTVLLFQKSENPVVIGMMAFAAVIAAPLCEEIVFRGYFYPVMKKFSGMVPAALCSSMVFAAAHGSLAALLPLFLFGCLLVFIYEKTGSLWSNIAIHFCFNAATVLIQLLVRYLHLPVDIAQ